MMTAGLASFDVRTAIMNNQDRYVRIRMAVFDAGYLAKHKNEATESDFTALIDEIVKLQEDRRKLMRFEGKA